MKPTDRSDSGPRITTVDWKRPPSEPDTGRPLIKLGPDVHLTCAAMVAVLRQDPELYWRSPGELVHVLKCGEDEKRHAPGTPLIRNMPVSVLQNRVSSFSRCMVRGKKIDPRTGEPGWVQVSPPRQQVQAVHEQGSWPGIRELCGIVETPSMRPDGSLIQEPGYDAATRTYYAPNAAYPEIPALPDHSAAVLAYRHLADVFADFPYVDESHRSAAVAAVLTLVARPAITGSVPAWVFDASAPRSGKSLQTDVISLIATGRRCSRMTYPEDDIELEKVLASYALVGARVVPFDNVARPFGGAPLDKVITAVDTVDLRKLGQTGLFTLPWRAVVLASGNNVRCRGDMLPRILSPRLESPLENPEARTDVAHEDLRAWVDEHRSDLARDALVLLRAYHVAGRPGAREVRWGGFDAWAALVAAALRWVGAPCPMGARRGLEDDDDPTRVAEGALLAGWERMCRERCQPSMTVSAAISLLYSSRHRDDEPDGFDDLREAIEQLTNSKPGFAPGTKRLGDAVRRLKGRRIGGMRFVVDGQTGKVARWRIVSTG